MEASGNKNFFDGRIAKAIARDIGAFRGPIREYPPLFLWRPVKLKNIRKQWRIFLDGSSYKQRSDLLGVFVNMLYCRDQCRYCDYMNAIKRDEVAIYAYLDAIRRDIDALELPARIKVNSLYVSGGNLAIVPPALLDRTLAFISSRFNFSNVSFKMAGLSHSPVDREMADVLRRWKFNRAVIQIQSMDEEFSRRIHRLVNRRRSEQGLAFLRKAGVSFIKAEWVVGLPGQSMDSFQRDLEWIRRAGSDQVVIVAFHPGKLSPLAGLEDSGWQPRFFKMSTKDILRREVMLKTGRAAFREKGGVSAPLKQETSVLGLGHGALSHIFGRFKYTFLNREKGRGSYYGVSMDQEREMRLYVVRCLMDRAHIDLDQTREFFGQGLTKKIEKEAQAIERSGLLVKEKNGWRVPMASPIVQMIIGAYFYEKKFKNVFLNRMRLYPRLYDFVDDDLIKLYPSQ